MNDFKPQKGGLVLDIGSNDGILLKYFQDKGMKGLGVDPMPGIEEQAKKNGVETLSEFFDDQLAENSLSVPLKEAREKFEKEYLTIQLKKFNGNISKTANFVGMERSALHRKLKGLGIKEFN